VRLDQRGRDERGVEPQVREEEGRGGQGLEGEVEGLKSRLEGAKGLSGQRLERSVARLERVSVAWVGGSIGWDV
jgi:hypothetical protein